MIEKESSIAECGEIGLYDELMRVQIFQQHGLDSRPSVRVVDVRFIRTLPDYEASKVAWTPCLGHRKGIPRMCAV